MHTTKNGYLTYNECEYLIPLIEVYDSFDDINFDMLPDKFVLKCSHDSGSVVICNDKAVFDRNIARTRLTKALNNEFWKYGREYQYKNIPHKIVCEAYIGDNINDYKIYTFGGKAEVIEVDFNRFVEHKRNIYDLKWNLLPISITYPNDPSIKIEKPEKLDTMIEISSLLMKNVNAPHCRVDFYYIKNKILFGEMTFTHECGNAKFIPDEWDIKFGDMIHL